SRPLIRATGGSKNWNKTRNMCGRCLSAGIARTGKLTMYPHNYQTPLLPTKMLSDSVLPADIRPPAVMPGASQPRHVLLTGATGFLGAYLLRTLLDETEADVYCLVRATTGDALARIRQNLERYGLWQSSLSERI